MSEAEVSLTELEVATIRLALAHYVSAPSARDELAPVLASLRRKTLQAMAAHAAVVA